MKDSCHPTAADKRFAADLFTVLAKLAREGKPVPAAESRRPKARPTKSPRRPS